MLHLDIPTRAELSGLMTERSDACLSLYLPTTPVTQDIEGARILYGNLTKEAVRQLVDAGFDKRRLAALTEAIDDLAEDDDFWAHQAYTLVVLATPDRIRTYRLANRLSETVQVSDRFHLAPLVRALTFGHAATVLALSENEVRVIEVSADGAPELVRLAEMPKDAASHAKKASINDRAHARRIHGSEGKKVRLAQFARKVDEVLRGYLGRSERPVILVAAEPIASIFRQISRTPTLAEDGVTLSPGTDSPLELATAVRPVLDRLHQREVAAFAERFGQGKGDGRALSDLDAIARAVTEGAVADLMFDMDAVQPGRISRATGDVRRASAPGPHSYALIDEIAARAMESGARLMAVRKDDLPDGARTVAALLRYAA